MIMRSHWLSYIVLMYPLLGIATFELEQAAWAEVVRRLAGHSAERPESRDLLLAIEFGRLNLSLLQDAQATTRRAYPVATLVSTN